MRTIAADLRAKESVAEAVVGVGWWAVGSAALPAGFGTLVLAAGLALAGALVYVGRRRPVYRERIPGAARRVLPLVVVGGLLVLAAVSALTALGFDSLAAPVASVIVGACYVGLAGRLQRQGDVIVGIALMGLGVGVALLALRSTQELHTQVLVGLVGGVLFWVAGALRLGLHRRLRDLGGRR
jgi:hypothetical protein